MSLNNYHLGFCYQLHLFCSFCKLWKVCYWTSPISFLSFLVMTFDIASVQLCDLIYAYNFLMGSCYLLDRLSGHVWWLHQVSFGFLALNGRIYHLPSLLDDFQLLLWKVHSTNHADQYRSKFNHPLLLPLFVYSYSIFMIMV